MALRHLVGYCRSIGQPPGNNIMLRWAVIFFVVAIITAALGFTGVAGAAAEIARVLFFVFLVLLVVALLAHALRGPPPK